MLQSLELKLGLEGRGNLFYFTPTGYVWNQFYTERKCYFKCSWRTSLGQEAQKSRLFPSRAPTLSWFCVQGPVVLSCVWRAWSVADLPLILFTRAGGGAQQLSRGCSWGAEWPEGWSQEKFCSPLMVTGFPGGASGKEPARQCRWCKRCMFDPWVGKVPWRRTGILAWKILWTEEPGGLQSIGSPRVQHDWSDSGGRHVGGRCSDGSGHPVGCGPPTSRGRAQRRGSSWRVSHSLELPMPHTWAAPGAKFHKVCAVRPPEVRGRSSPGFNPREVGWGQMWPGAGWQKRSAWRKRHLLTGFSVPLTLQHQHCLLLWNTPPTAFPLLPLMITYL